MANTDVACLKVIAKKQVIARNREEKSAYESGEYYIDTNT